jgi:hypothetical protein
MIISPASVWFACGVQDKAYNEEKDRLVAETEETKSKLSAAESKANHLLSDLHQQQQRLNQECKVRFSGQVLPLSG